MTVRMTLTYTSGITTEHATINTCQSQTVWHESYLARNKMISESEEDLNIYNLISSIMLVINFNLRYLTPRYSNLIEQ